MTARDHGSCSSGGGGGDYADTRNDSRSTDGDGDRETI